mmetsp:Transcript_15799/g.39762  ORF Transcript_15799/g.39762 Transcript_15799/m.39762 type:complete len:250 (-) Transcript_15799:189-938(-)
MDRLIGAHYRQLEEGALAPVVRPAHAREGLHAVQGARLGVEYQGAEEDLEDDDEEHDRDEEGPRRLHRQHQDLQPLVVLAELEQAEHAGDADDADHRERARAAVPPPGVDGVDDGLDVEGQDGHQVNHVHQLLHEDQAHLEVYEPRLDLLRGRRLPVPGVVGLGRERGHAHEARDVLDGEDDDADDLQDLKDDGRLLVELGQRQRDERRARHQDGRHHQGAPDLGQAAEVGVLHRVPHPIPDTAVLHDE